MSQDGTRNGIRTRRYHLERMVTLTNFVYPSIWLQEQESNVRYTVYETVELPLLYPAKYGANERSRTSNLLFTRQLLFQLSYIGIGTQDGAWTRTRLRSRDFKALLSSNSSTWANGQDKEIRTPNLTVPSRALYQVELYPDLGHRPLFVLYDTNVSFDFFNHVYISFWSCF